MPGEGIGAAVGVVVALAAAPYLARLTLSVPDRDERTWWRGRAAGRGRTAWTALTAGALGALAGAAAGWSAVLPAFLALAVTTAPLVVIDVEHHRLPDRLVVASAAGAAVLLVAAGAVRGDWAAVLRAAEGAAAVFAALFALAFAAPASFGFGDVKLGGVLGAYLGWFGWRYVGYGIFAGFLLGLVVAVVLLATRRASLKSAVAFGPMLVFGALIVLAFDLVPSLGAT